MTEYTSSRGSRLIYCGQPTTPTLTVENYEKWYSLYLVKPDGQVEELPFPEQDEYGPLSGPAFVDHVPNPKAVQLLAQARGYEICSQSFEMIVGRWTIEVSRDFELDSEHPVQIASDAAGIKTRELLNTVADMQAVANSVYNFFFWSGMGARAHAFLEWNGLLQKYVSLCRDAALAGIDFRQANVHTGVTMPVAGHDVEYLAEKIRCIFKPFFGDKEVQRRFMAALFQNDGRST